MLIANNINHKFKELQLFDGLSLKVHKGDFTAIKGRSGSGKSSLLNMFIGFVKPDSGTLQVDGLEVNAENIKSIRRKIAWVPQNISFFKTDVVKDAILKPFEFTANRAIFPDNSLINQYFKELALDVDLLNQSVEDLSGGEKQRVMIIIAKLLKRDIIILDEPSSALDKASVERVVDFIKDESKTTTILSATHDDLWLSKCDNIIDLG